MLKIITLITKFILVALTALLFASCNHTLNLRSIEGSGNVTTEKRIVQGDFKSIEVSNAIDLVIEQSDVTEIVVEADDNLQKHILTKVENGTLIISCDKNSFINTKSKKVTVKMPVIDQLEANSSASITSINTIKGENITLNTSSAGTINLSLESDDITCDSSSGSSINISGMGLKMKANASSGSAIEAENLMANEVNAEASSGATIRTHPIVSLDAEASSGGSISYNKVPKSLRKESNSGGSIRQE
ncbi:head GIN domain-containing protein [Flavobacterium sp. GT2N3]|uniref:head GIN domain-containing protein n=1 Tax=unclassified Flavobacterium TaxID=196869 RepID=UPI003AB02343